MKKILIMMLTTVTLMLTACQPKESFDFLLGEKNIGLTFNYDQVHYENAEAQKQFEQIFASKRDGLENAFLNELNDEIEDVYMRAYRTNALTPADPLQINYTFEVLPTEVTTHGITNAIVHVYDKAGREQRTFNLHARKELDRSFIERLFDSMEDLGERLGEQIRYGM